MHEYAMMQRIVDSIRMKLDEMGADARDAVAAIQVTVGALDIHSERAFRQAFEVQTRQTALAGVELKMTIAPAHYRCACGHDGRVGDGQVDPHEPLPFIECATCGAVCAVEGGRGVFEIDLELKSGESQVPSRK